MYRTSKLTYLLKNSLGGNSKTLMIVNVSPSKECQKETERTLEFGREVHLQNNFIFFNIDYYNYINLLCLFLCYLHNFFYRSAK